MNSFQADLVLDVYDQCARVTAAYDQFTATKYSTGTAINYAKNRAQRESNKAAYQKAVRELCETYNYALGEGVPSDTLDACCEKYLPKDITIVNGEVVT